MESMIRDIGLAASGQKKIDWVKGHMPLLNYFNEKYAPTQLFKGINMVVTIHLEAKTAYLALTLKNCGANVTVTGSNPLSTQDDVAAALVANGVTVFATHACTNEEYDLYLDKALDTHPQLIVDDGGDSLSDEKLKLRFEDFPVFPAEIFARVQPKDSLKRKQFEKGILQLSQDGAVQVFTQKHVGLESFMVGVVGQLQLEVLEYRLKNEYNAQLVMTQLPFTVARWVYADKLEDIEKLRGLDNGMLVYDKKDRPVILVNNEWALNWILQRNPGLEFLVVPSDKARV